MNLSPDVKGLSLVDGPFLLSRYDIMQGWLNSDEKVS